MIEVGSGTAEGCLGGVDEAVLPLLLMTSAANGTRSTRIIKAAAVTPAPTMWKFNGGAWGAPPLPHPVGAPGSCTRAHIRIGSSIRRPHKPLQPVGSLNHVGIDQPVVMAE